MRFAIGILLALTLCGCATVSGVPSSGFATPEIGRAYIPIEGRTYAVMENRGAAFVIAPGIAVTNAHNGVFLRDVAVIGTSRNYDLLFFRSDRAAAPVYSSPSVGERVLAYGQGSHGEVREAQGSVNALNQAVVARCQTCLVQGAFTYLGNAGPGFSGGPVVDAVSGAIVGITFGYNDDEHGQRIMYAYSIARIRNELAVLQGRLPTEVERGGAR
jgi:hypothetical protein